MEDKLKSKVQSEYAQGFEHVRDERERKRDILEKVLPQNLPDGQVRVNLLWKNIQLENSLFLTDDVNVDFVAEDGVLANELVRNASKAMKHDNEDMDLYEMREDIVNYNALYGLAVTAVLGWCDDEVQPVSDTIDPLSVIPDPKNWRGSKMRWIGFERRVMEDSLDPEIFGRLSELSDFASGEMRLNDVAYNNANRTINQTEQDGLVDIYDHFTIYDGKKWLTTWANNRDKLIRCVEIEPLTAAEKSKPDKVKFPVQLHRRKVKLNSFFGVSIADEIMQFQDAVSVLTNLQLIQARIAALGPDKFIDQNLGLDAATLGKRLPWGRIIPVNTQGQAIGQSFFTDINPNPSQFPSQMKNELNSLAEQNTGAGAIAFGQSFGGDQTKAEIQTLQQNSNQLLAYVASNYLRGQKEYWEAHYRAYCLYMGKKQKKRVSLFENGSAYVASLSRNDFVTDGKVSVYVTSKAQENAKKDKTFAKLVSISNLYIGNMKRGYAMNSFLRKLGDALGIENFDPSKFIQESPEEMQARMNLELINRNIEPEMPEPGEDVETYLQISKEAVDTPAKSNYLQKLSQLLIQTRGQSLDEVGTPDATNSAMAMNMVTWSEAKKVPSTSNIAF